MEELLEKGHEDLDLKVLRNSSELYRSPVHLDPADLRRCLGVTQTHLIRVYPRASRCFYDVPGMGRSDAIAHPCKMATKPHKEPESLTGNIRVAKKLAEHVRAGQAEFVMTELDTSITFCEVALATNDSARRVRNIKNASTGYRTALHFAGNRPDIENDQEFQEKVAKLKGLLHKLGQAT